MKSMTTISRLLVGAVVLSMVTGCGGGAKEEDVTAASDASAAANPAAPPAADAAPVAYASLTGDAVHGEKVFLQCKACHVVEAGQNRLGPSLHGIIGRTAGRVPDYSYSAANKASGIVWTEEELFAYLEHPQQIVPGTKMVYAGMASPQDRADLIAYLKKAT